jgi:hypothetical protein
MVGMDARVRNSLILISIRWAVMLGLIFFGIFAHHPWAVAAGIAIAAIGMIYSAIMAAKPKKRPAN